MNIDNKKEFINSLRHKANHIFVLITTIGASLTKLFIDGKTTKWFLGWFFDYGSGIYNIYDTSYC